MRRLHWISRCELHNEIAALRLSRSEYQKALTQLTFWPPNTVTEAVTIASDALGRGNTVYTNTVKLHYGRAAR